MASHHPHSHAAVSDGASGPGGSFHPLPGPDPRQAALLFRHHLLLELLRRDVITERTVEILDRFRHPGFSVYVGRPVAAEDRAGRECLASYILHLPFSGTRLTYDESAGTVSWLPKAQAGHFGGRPAGGGFHDAPGETDQKSVRKRSPDLSALQ